MDIKVLSGTMGLNEVQAIADKVTVLIGYEFREAYVTKNSVILRLMQSLSRHMVDFEGYEYNYINNTLSNCWIFKIENSLIF